MKGLKLKLVYWLMKSMRMRFVAFEINKDETLSIREKISTIYESLDKQQFLQIHKSFVVAIKQIKSIEGNQIFVSDHVIPIGKLYKNNVLQLLK